MPQTLTKPVLLDETGQEIAGKLDTNSAAIIEALDDIKEAIGTSGEFVPLMIKVIAPPTKTIYIAGDTLDLTGMVVNLIASNGTQIDITSACTFSPANGAVLSSADTNVVISYYYAETSYTFTTNQPIAVTTLSSIEITTPPTQLEYVVGDELDLTGIVITAHFDNGSSMVATDLCLYSPADGDTLTTANTSITVSLTMGSTTKTTTQAITVYAIYGVEWDGSATSAWTRTDAAAGFTDPVPYYAGMSETPSSPFDNIMPWSGMEIFDDESISFDTYNYARKFVSIPKFYYKLTQNGAGLKIQITQGAAEGFHISPAHMDRGDGQGERDIVYVGRYHMPNQNATNPYTPYKRSQFRASAHYLGTEVWQWDFAMMFTIWLLYLVEFADWNSQEKIGYGCNESTTAGTTTSQGRTNNMPYHTGTSQSSKTTYGTNIQYRHIEGLWDGVWDYVDGCYNIVNSNVGEIGLYIILNPTDFSDTTGGVRVGTPATGAYPSAFEVKDVNGAFPMFIPSASAGSSSSEYSCDSWQFNSECLVHGGSMKQKTQFYGLFHMEATGKDVQYQYAGTRFMKLPANS